MFEITMPIGDWSKDGHGECDEIDFVSNCAAGDLQEAYKASVKLTGISFDYDTDPSATLVCADYGDYIIPTAVMDKFVELGYSAVIDGDFIEEDGISFMGEGKSFAELILWFIGLSMPKDWEWYIVEKPKPIYLNGFWSKPGWDVSFGYGLYD
jgi:hypothetical protein